MQTLYYGGPILTMEKDLPLAEAVLVTDGQITAVGSRQELAQLATEAVQRDLHGGTLLPGFIDGHSHLSAMAYQQLIVNANPPPSGSCDSIKTLLEECRRSLKDHPPADGGWLLGMGYDNTSFSDGRHPTKEELDTVSRDIPILITHASGHLCVVNSRAMELLGYSGDTYTVPEGGVVDPSGLLKEQAFLAPEKQARIQGPAPDKMLDAVGKASALYASYGITTAQDGRTGQAEYALLIQAGKMGLLKTDVVLYLTPEWAEAVLPKQAPQRNSYVHQCRTAGCKFFLDGSPQGKTAWLSAPYLVPPDGEAADYRGFPVQRETDVKKLMERSLRNHWQINVHANGDEAIEQMIRCYKQAVEQTGIHEDLRPVVIHCQTVREDQLDRMQRLGIMPSYFLDHVYYWGDYHRDSVLGEACAAHISPLASTVRRGMRFTMHQDSPVVPPNILLSVHNAVNRRTKSGQLLGADQRISVEEALRAVTCYAAYQIFEEKQKGSMAKGKRADFVLLDRNPLECPPEDIQDIRVLETIRNGVCIYRAEN